MADPKQVQIRNMDPELWGRLKAMAAIEDKPLHAVVQRLLRDALTIRVSTAEP